jgi:Uma2 family endonuclease
MHGDPAEKIELTLEFPASNPRWELSDDEKRMPENPLHDLICRLLMDVLERWIHVRDVSAQVGGNIALRWDAANPKEGVDPDVYLVEPAPPHGLSSASLCTWQPGCVPPRVVVEVVSRATADVDYHDKPARYAASKVRELWIYDPERKGPRSERCRLQVWRRGKRGGLRRVYAGDGPAYSDELGAWLVLTEGGMRLRIADHEDGSGLWPTAAEAERAAKEAERAAKESALAEIERLRAELARRGG